MNILIVSEYFYPDDFRVNEIVEELVKAGHHVKVLTGLPDYTTSRIPREYKWFRRRKELLFGAEVVRVPIIARRTGVLFRMLNYGSFMLTSWLYSCFCCKKEIDLIFVYQITPVFQGVPAMRLKRRTGKKLKLYCCDLWPESLKAWNVSESGFVFRTVKKISKKIYHACDEIAVSSRPFQEYLHTVLDVPEERMTYIPQHSKDAYREICGQYEENGCVDFLFAGNIGAVQNVDCIIRAVPHITAKQPYRIHIVGSGSELDNCKKLVQELGVTDRVCFYGRYPLAEMEQFYKMADCFLLTLRGGDFIGKTLPGKSQAYLGAGKPIVGAIDGAASEMIAESDCGVCVPAGDDKALGEAMSDVIEHFSDYRQKGLNGRRFYEEHYTKERFMESLTRFLEE